MEEHKIDLRRRGDDLPDSTQTNFRIFPEDADTFRQFCKEVGINQADGFSYMVSLLEPLSKVSSSSRFLHSNTILKRQITNLKHRLRKARAENKGLRKLLKKINQGRELMARARMGIECCLLFSRYLFQYGASKPAAPSGEIVSFHEGLRKGSTAYTYPAKGEIKVLSLDFMCYDGNSVLCHLRNEKGEKLKMRMWPKNHFQPLCGSMNFVNSQFSVAGSRWLCAYGKMHNGFIELLCAIPAPDWFASQQEIIHVDNAQTSSSLESLINNAEVKKGS